MIGFDIGGTKCAVSVGKCIGDRVDVICRKQIPTDHSVSPQVMIERMCALAESMTDDFSRIGISCGGPLDPVRGVIMSPPNLPGWDDVNICDMLHSKWGGRVNLRNDADACALAEWRFGAGKGSENMVFLTFGSGMGAGLILGGRLHTGACGMAGEVGHMRLTDFGPVGYGKAGSFEGFCSGNGIAELARMLAREQLQMGRCVSYCRDAAELPAVSAKSVAEMAYAGNRDALEVYRICGEKLGRGLALLVDILNPERIIIGSVYQRSGSLLRDAMMEVLRKECLPQSLAACEILPAKLGDYIGDYAALAVAAEGGI